MTAAKAHVRWRKMADFPRKTTASADRLSAESSRVTFAQAKRLLISEAAKLGAALADVFLNLPADSFSQSGYGIRAKATKNAFPGVYVVFYFPKVEMVFCCDRHRRWQRNLYSIGVAIRALRSLSSSGVTRLGEQFGPFCRARQEPPPPPRSDNWYDNVTDLRTVSGAAKFLELFGDSTAGQIAGSAEAAKAAFRQAARKLHPDAGGTQDKFERLTKAWETLRRHHGI